MEALQVLNFDPARVMAHPRVLEWMSELVVQSCKMQIPHVDTDDDDFEYWKEYDTMA